MVPSCATAGELKMMSPVAYDQERVPSRATPYNFPSCDPTTTEPSAATAGDDTTGPPVATTHQIEGLTAGNTKGERPRCAGPSRNIACAGSIAYWGNGVVGRSGALGPIERSALAGQTQRPTSHRRLSLQSLSDAHWFGSTWAQLGGTRAAMTAERTTAVTRLREARRKAGREATGDGRSVRMGEG